MKAIIFFICLCFSFSILIGQNQYSPCSYESILQKSSLSFSQSETEINETEILLQQIIQERKELRPQGTPVTYIIPVVMHIFHVGDDAKMGMEQIQSGLKILNEDFNGLNDGWNTIDNAFDSIKGTLDIQFCLATIDPQGAPTTGVNYYEDENAINNEGDLFQHAWDNSKYLNIYFPKYTQGGPSDFTAYAYYPSTTNTMNNRDGIFYSSIRWGYGKHSILEEGDDWASVCSHEAGHWLNLRHTFESGCSTFGDFVDDTPPTLGSGIELTGCNNNDFSCGAHTNGSNFMDYNHRCKKMFTQGQIERMTAALYLPSRINLWSEENLIETGCSDINTSTKDLAKLHYSVYPNPASDYIIFELSKKTASINIYNLYGQVVSQVIVENNKKRFDTRNLKAGFYSFIITSDKGNSSGQFIVL